MAQKDQVKKVLEKTKKQESQKPKNREVHPFDSNVIFREELLIQLGRIANALEVLATKNEKSV